MVGVLEQLLMNHAWLERTPLWLKIMKTVKNGLFPVSDRLLPFFYNELAANKKTEW